MTGSDGTEGARAEEQARALVRDGYDKIAERYLARKDPGDPTLLSFLEQVARGVPPRGRVLDLGCGAGVPATRWLGERFRVVGVDLSPHQLALARRHVPTASLVLADMAEIAFPPRSFEAVVSLYAIIHVPAPASPASSHESTTGSRRAAFSSQPGR